MTQANLRLVEGISVDKTKALDAALSQIERAFGKGSIMRLGKNQKAVEIETIPTGSLGLDIALGVGGRSDGILTCASFTISLRWRMRLRLRLARW